MAKKKIRLALISGILVVIFAVSGNAQDPETKKEEELAGEFSGFGIKVSRGNYYFIKRVLLVLGPQSSAPPKTAEELEAKVWEDLVLSYEAYRRGVKAEDKEVEDELGKLLKSEKVTFDWKKDPEAYAKWVQEKTQEPRELFENQLRHMIQLKKLRQQVMDSITLQVQDEEVRQKFLDEYNNISLELAQFDALEPAQKFYARVKKKPKLWEKETKQNPKLFRRPGFVALEFLMDMWKFPRQELFKMLKLTPGTVLPPVQIYSGKYGVCKILQKRLAEESRYAQVKADCQQRLVMQKKYEGMLAWVKKIKEDAGIKVYPPPAAPEQAAPK